MKGRILYFTKMNFGFDVNFGFKKKVFAQSDAFRSYGFEVDICFIENNDVVIENLENSREFECRNAIARSYFQFLSLPARIKIQDYDVLYIRHFLTNPLFLIFLKRCKKQHPKLKIIMEIPTYPYQFEHKDIAQRFKYLMDAWCFKYFKKYISRIVTFSQFDEIAGIKTIKTHNGIDVNEKIAVINIDFNAELNLVCLANIQPWHGFDRVIEGLQHYKGDKIVKFHIVGSGSELAHLEALVSKYKLENQVIFYGHKTADALENIFSTMHIGVANLAFHRVQVSNGETSALKSREYALRGLPFLIGYVDRDFPSDFPFKFQVNSDETAINISSLIEQYIQMRKSNPTFNTDLQHFAKSTLGWKNKLGGVVEYINGNIR